MANPFERARIKKPKSFKITPQMAESKRAELGNEALGAFNTATFGIPRAVANKTAKLAYGQNQPEVVPEGGTIGRILGLFGAGGLVRGGIKAIAPKLIGRGVAKTMTRGAIEGGITSQAVEPGLESGAVGALLGAAGEPLIAGAGNLYNATFGKARFLKDVQKEFRSTIQSKKGEFGKFLSEAKTKFPGRTADMSDAMNELRVSRTYNPDIDNIIKNNPDLERLVNNPELAAQIPVDVAQDLINSFSKPIPQPVLSGATTARPHQLQNIRGREALMEGQASAFPEILPQRKSYAQTKNVERSVGRSFKDESIESKLGKGFPTLVEEKMEKVLGKEYMKKLKGYKQASQVKGLILNPITMGGAGVTGGAIYAGNKLSELARRNQQ